MTTSADILALVAAALLPVDGGTAPTSAEDRVKRPGDLPTQQDQYPILKLRVVSEHRTSLGRGEVQFTTLVTVRVVGEVSAQASLDDPALSDIEQQLWALKREGEIAIINSYPLFSSVQQLASIDTQLSFTAQATHLAGIQSDYAFEFFEGEEDFAPVAADNLDEVELALTNHSPTGFTADLTA